MDKSNARFQLVKAYMTFGGDKKAPRDYGLNVIPNVPGLGTDLSLRVTPDDDDEGESDLKQKMRKKRQMLNRSLLNKGE